MENDDNGWIISNTHFITTYDFKGENNNIEESKNLQDFINCQKGVHEGIECIHCGSKCDKLGYYTLAVLPEILVVVIKKYKFNKKSSHGIKLNVNTSLPKKMTFEKQDGGEMVYRPVSQILHSGGLEGGHYWAHTLRQPRLVDFNMRRDQESVVPPTGTRSLCKQDGPHQSFLQTGSFGSSGTPSSRKTASC